MSGLPNNYQGSNRSSGAFLLNKNQLAAQRDRSGGNSDEQTRDNITSHVQGGVGYGPESSKNFNNTQHVFFS